jgi:hypothetical protein
MWLIDVHVIGGSFPIGLSGKYCSSLVSSSSRERERERDVFNIHLLSIRADGTLAQLFDKYDKAVGREKT